MDPMGYNNLKGFFAEIRGWHFTDRNFMWKSESHLSIIKHSEMFILSCMVRLKIIDFQMDDFNAAFGPAYCGSFYTLQ